MEPDEYAQAKPVPSLSTEVVQAATGVNIDNHGDSDVNFPEGIDTETKLAIKKAIQLGRAKDEAELEKLQRRYKDLEDEARELDLREQVLWATGECIDIYDTKIRLVEAARKKSKENALRARDIQMMEEQTFLRNAIDFYTLFQGNMYAIRQADKDECSFLLNSTMTNAPGEMLILWDDERLVIRPSNHGEYNVSVPASVLCKRGIETRVRPHNLNGEASCTFPTLKGSTKNTDFGPIISKMKSNGRFERTPITRDVKDVLRGIKKPVTEEGLRYVAPTPRRGRAGASY